MKISSVIAAVLALITPASSVPINKCACASVDTDIEKTYGFKTDRFGTLRSPDCLPYIGDEKAINDGRIYAHVVYNSQSAWLLTSDIYIKDCYDSFNCVCTTSDVDVKMTHSTSGLKLGSLSAGECMSIQGKLYNSSTETWIQVEKNGEIGWIRKDYLAFHNCQGPRKSLPPRGQQFLGCPRIITRAEWGARKAKAGIGTLPETPRYAFIHHGATAGCNTTEECVRMIQSYQNYHMDGHGWYDIGYSFVIGEDGNVYEGRGWDEIGAHTRHYNDVGLGFCVIGNFMQRVPNKAALKAVEDLIKCGVTTGKLTPTYTLLGHRDTNPTTLCPGDKFYELIQDWKHYGYLSKMHT